MNNESAIEFYKKFGFNIVETKEQYYKRIEPADAHVLEKFLKEDQQTDHSKISNGVGEVSIYKTYPLQTSKKSDCRWGRERTRFLWMASFNIREMTCVM